MYVYVYVYVWVEKPKFSKSNLELWKSSVLGP